MKKVVSLVLALMIFIGTNIVNVEASTTITTAQIDGAILWAQNQDFEKGNGGEGWSGWCLKFVQYAYQSQGISTGGAYGFATNAGNALITNTDTNPPRGALVFWNWTGTIDEETKNWGHVGISLGNGYVIHADYSGIKTTSLNIGNSRSYRGWGIWKGYTLAQATLPATPTITSCSVSGSSITVSWNAVDAATNYSVDFCKVAGDTYNHSYTSTTATTMTKTLEDGLYAVRVEAGNSAGSSGFTSFKYLWVSNNNVPISPEITEVYVDGNNVTVLWDWVDYTNEFSVEFYSTINDSSEFFKVSDNSCTTRLETGRYGVRVFGVNTAGAKSKETDFTYFDLGAVSVKFDACGGSLDNAPKASYEVSSVNGQRGEDQLVIFTGSGTTGTNIYGGEALVDANNKVAEIIREVGNATIPTNGMILSGHRAAYYWIVENIEIGDYVYFDDAANMVYIYTEDAYMVNNKTAIYGGAYGELPVPEKDGYIFKGWFTEPTGGREITSSTVASVSEEHVLYAQWEAEEEYIDATVGVKNDTYRITVNNNLKNGKIIVAGYNGDVLVSVKSHAAAEEDIATVFEGNKIDVVKVLAWEGLPSLKPAMMQEIAKDEFLDASKEVWVLKSELPEGKEIINTKYTYVLTSYAESEESEMEGWDCYSSKWVITGGGDFKYASFPSGFDTNSVYYQTMQTQAKTAYETENTKRVIETTPGGYIYWHWCRNSYTSGPINRWVEDAYKSTSMGNFFTFHAFEDTADVTESDGESCYKYSNANCCKDSYWYYKLPCSICYYTDYSKVFMFKKVQEFETEAYPEGENISNVQEWVCYVE